MDTKEIMDRIGGIRERTAKAGFGEKGLSILHFHPGSLSDVLLMAGTSSVLFKHDAREPGRDESRNALCSLSVSGNGEVEAGRTVHRAGREGVSLERQSCGPGAFLDEVERILGLAEAGGDGPWDFDESVFS